ncbi:MAG TPA: hypothetical protein VG603_01110 [Chitinophagales bacterium]|nr:hypothetical protein [Chitinophagales bacterium]
MEVGFTIAKKKINPFVQVGLAAGIAWLGMLICKIAGLNNGEEYFTAMVGLIFYALINTVVSIAYSSYLRYTVPSYYIYIGLVIVLLLSARVMSGISIWTLEEYRMMLFSITMFYVVASILVRAVRYIYELAESGL